MTKMHVKTVLDWGWLSVSCLHVALLTLFHNHNTDMCLTTAASLDKSDKSDKRKLPSISIFLNKGADRVQGVFYTF